MSLSDQIAADVSQVFMNPADFAVPVQIARESYSIEVNAVVGASQFETSSEFGATSFETRDFIFEPRLFDFGNGPEIPKRGDLFTDGGLNYIAVNPAQGIDCYALDETRQLMTVHTVKTS